MESSTSVFGIEMLEHDLNVLDKAPAGVYIKALKITDDGCPPKAIIVKIDKYTEIDNCGIEVK